MSQCSHVSQCLCRLCGFSVSALSTVWSFPECSPVLPRFSQVPGSSGHSSFPRVLNPRVGDTPEEGERVRSTGEQRASFCPFLLPPLSPLPSLFLLSFFPLPPPLSPFSLPLPSLPPSSLSSSPSLSLFQLECPKVGRGSEVEEGDSSHL